jgi:chromosome partitioning protein
VIDLDPQANLTSSLGLKDQDFDFSVYHWLKGDAPFDQVATAVAGIHLVPSSVALSGADIELSSVPGREQLLKEALLSIRDRFDCILVDCPPSLGLLTLNALTAVDGIFIPIQAEYLPLEGVKFLLETIDIVKRRLNNNLQIAAVIVTMFDSRQNLHREVVQGIRQYFGEKVMESFIRKNIALAEAPSFGQSIYEYKADSIGAMDYGALCREMMRREVLG